MSLPGPGVLLTGCDDSVRFLLPGGADRVAVAEGEVTAPIPDGEVEAAVGGTELIETRPWGDMMPLVARTDDSMLAGPAAVLLESMAGETAGALELTTGSPLVLLFEGCTDDGS
mmetsp:Transcript_7867/g.15831  ORF Transcript_7867/g.15831 Transcript_7867/m.15831 type:complete len:114 (-) Transcript_7867:774-1115(-)